MLTLMKAAKGAQAKYPGTFHIGFFIENKESVDNLNLRLRQDGFDVPARGGFTVEVGA